MKKKIIIIGAGGHAKVLLNALGSKKSEVIGFTDSETKNHGKSIVGVKVLGNDDVLKQYCPDDVVLVNGVGYVKRGCDERKKVYERLKNSGYEFLTVVHETAVLSLGVELSEGVQVMAGVVLQPDVKVGPNVIINTGACLDHDCHIDAHTHIAPGVVLSGGVKVGSGTLIGTGSNVKQGVTIGSNTVIGVGSAVYKDVEDGVCYVGTGRII